jgi:hypothetical protein
MDNAILTDEWMDYIRHLEAKVRELEGALEDILTWANAYPLSVFPEPDFRKAYHVLREHGMSLDAISASNMRHVLKGVKGIVEQAIKEGEGGPAGA